MRRRGVILGGLGLGIAAVLWRRTRPPQLALQDHPDVPGFMTLAGVGAPQVSSGAARDPLFVGLPQPQTAQSQAAQPDAETMAAITADPAAALFHGAPEPAIAYFTDIRCPICRPLEANLDALQAARPGLMRITHDYPIFGAGSELAARALIAAGRDLAPQLRTRLARSSVVVDHNHLRRVISGLGADPDPIIANLDSPETLQTLAQTRALAQLFGLYGTPALVLGRAVVLGVLSLPSLHQILDLQSQGA